ncbi:unnamed protein product [Triticum turgidum subsp. durum]|uniref:Gamma-glutamylcyclotransferase family protein n=1 Tax=Triticum turgidum subsp. durum TaxID=4567 RepID=A0A9R0W2T0_TRITD|nr:unnamed protein product [Triticum turgidum subsp. durum]
MAIQGLREASLGVQVVLIYSAAEEVVAYYAHRGYAAEMWARSGRRGHAEYSPAVAAGYVRRVDRPQHLTFLDQIHVFVSSQS